MIIWGWKIKPIAEIDVDLPEFKAKCEKHDLPLRIIVGKKYYTLYFIPINYFFAKEKIFQVCPKCSEDYGEIDDEEIENIVLNYYHKKITINDLRNQIKKIMDKK